MNNIYIILLFLVLNGCTGYPEINIPEKSNKLEFKANAGLTKEISAVITNEKKYQDLSPKAQELFFQKQYEIKMAAMLLNNDKISSDQVMDYLMKDSGKVHRNTTSNEKKSSKPINNIDLFIATIEGISNDKICSKFIIDNISNIGSRIDGNDLSRIMKASSISNDYYYVQTVVESSKHLILPIEKEDISEILSEISNDTYQSMASNALLRVIMK